MTTFRPQPRSGAYHYERRTCESCGARFRLWRHHGEALASCAACCLECEESGCCASCGDRAD